jgi:hypothetical protein
VLEFNGKEGVDLMGQNDVINDLDYLRLLVDDLAQLLKHLKVLVL